MFKYYTENGTTKDGTDPEHSAKGGNTYKRKKNILPES